MTHRGSLVGGAAIALALGTGLSPAVSHAAPDAGAPPDGGARVWTSCVEHLPEGATRPKLQAKLPQRGMSGYEARLVVIIEHGRGETVLPDGFRLQRSSDAAKAIEAAGFTFPHPDGGSGPLIDRGTAKGDATTVTSTLSIPFVPLPEEPGRHLLTLPPVPIAVARASGEVMTLCTAAHRIVVEDPIANENDPQVKPNPLPRTQREEWLFAKQAVAVAAAALVLALVLLWLLLRWRRRPKAEKPKPKVLPWIAAMQRLEEIRSSAMLDEGQLDEYFDAVSECTRGYLGDRYGFDGLESTSEEMRRLLTRVFPQPPDLDAINAFLEETDFLKYAEVEPTVEDCEQSMARALRIVAATTPAPTKPKAAASAETERAA